MVKIQYATISETGKRKNNEDAFRMVGMPDGNRWLAVVCDGMGGHDKGEVASETVADAIVNYWRKAVDEIDSKDKVEKACLKARVALDKCAFTMGNVKMGTTMVMASIEGDTVTIAHLGDSRCYLMRPGVGLLYLTKDHIRMEYGWEIIDRCFFSYRPEVCIPDVVSFKLKVGDRIMLCSDGLYNSMALETLIEYMMDKKSPNEILDAYRIHCEMRSYDNYTAVLIAIT
ncbi:MAG: protein phosphatase 2C domain-containing protein [Prevotellaceae bacterium]|nr:protein phosphatase 2C domain-containing protein [Prevotellaceae bacterium]